MEEKKVLISTSFGDMTVKLYNETPKHRDNFLKLVEQGFYDDLLFHRVIKNFMIQGGEPDSKLAKKGQSLGVGDVGYTIPAEFVPATCFHKKGALAAARQGDQVNPNKESSGCQFYIVQGEVYNENKLMQMERQALQSAKNNRFNQLVKEHYEEVKQLRLARDKEGLMNLQEKLIGIMESEFEGKKSIPMSAEQREAYSTIGGTPFLDNEYTVFGEVIDGLDVIDKIAAVKKDRSDRPEEDIRMKLSVL